ncbi:MAG TPA: OmpA family protein [Geothermobacteraceae bacterium]|jgi:OOP family OmpA-OmpF porin|nr:OmpA family protein [Geothermobacteraceae bacterium]
MKKKSIQLFLLAAIILLFAGCAGMKAKEPPLVFTPHAFPAGQYTQKVDNALFILDASYTMEKYGERDFVTAKNVIGAIHQSLPTDPTLIAGLRTFGHHPRQSEKLTDRVYGMTKYTRDGLQQGLDGVKYAGGNSPMPEALEAASGDLKGAQGKTALIIVSDGLVEAQMSGAPEAAAKLKGELGDKLCIYTIAVGGDSAGEKFLQEVAKAGGCGFSETAASLSAPDKLASFVERVFLSKKAMAAAPVAATGPLDSDGDGVIDARDKCPDTPKGEIVDENGCTLKLTLHINFDFDKSDIKPEFAADLQTAGDFVLKNKNVPYIVITGYTDSVGEEDYNQKLSERRAAAVRQYLIDNFGIDPDRLAARGGGESSPVADNSTENGRYENRRVEIVCCAILPPLR